MTINAFIVILFCAFTGIAQNSSKAQLETYEDEALLDYFNEVSHDSIQAEIVARVYLDRGRAEGDTIKMARGYDRLARIFHPEKNIQFADSVISLTENMNHITYPALGYMLKGAFYGVMNDVENEMNNYLKCYDLAYENNNQIQQAWILHQLIIGKTLWGDKNEALKLQLKRDSLINTEEYYQNLKITTRNNSSISIDELKLINQINSYTTFSFIYLSLREFDSVNKYLKKEKELLRKYNNKDKLQYELSLLKYTLETRYHEKNYKEAIFLSDSILSNSHINDLSKNDLFILNSILGLSELRLNNVNSGIKYLEKCDSLSKIFEYEFHPDDRLVFEELLKIAAINKDYLKQINYLNRLRKIDSSFIIKYKYYDPNMLKRFDIPRLLEEKDILVSGLTIRNQIRTKTIWVISCILMMSVLFLFYYFNRQKVYKKRYESLILKNSAILVNENSLQAKEAALNEISPEIVSEILAKLESFEAKKQFLSDTVNLHSLAKKFNTNQNYLSRVINLKIEKNFSQYLNDLRIKFALEELKNNAIFRKYSVKAIANECGFKTPESFSKAFYKEVGFYPSYYIKNLEKDAS
ncbi:helix-turn-helix domain-containing protein [Jejudonia soesokkakensis]|uniref:Helix-turn-helix domain-containing protein n=1 Tax=Jejudonia soesokkakensis TaxID=1323432 RepID=A0ABW2MUB7_9FLAO